MSTQNPRKRPAPGSIPMIPIPQVESQTQPLQQQQQHSQQQPQQQTQLPQDQPQVSLQQQPYLPQTSDALVRWNGSNDSLGFLGTNGVGGFNFPSPTQEVQRVPSASNSLARRDVSRALVPTASNFNPSMDAWFGEDPNLYQPNVEDDLGGNDSIEALEEMAQKAKRDASGKRKAIPPFVQKLSSFLEEQKNEELIHWSEDGQSFIVEDEDEFAKTLIPELFKHKNYASFVRQLNMYGFHKKVGLSDNSMRASERRNKSPSEYFNPYFKRGHPDLLWLINKPKTKTNKGKAIKGEADGDSDDELAQDFSTGQGNSVPKVPSRQALPPASSSSQQPIQGKEMKLIREELDKVRDQQKLILEAFNRIQKNNNDLYQQAMMFQSQHERHQNSINAILNFLANVFRKTLEDQGNSQNVNDIISSMISNQGQPGAQHGSVVDLGDIFQAQADHAGNMPGTHKRARGLLPPVPGYETGRAQTRSPSTGSTPYNPMGSHDPEIGHITELPEGSPADTPPNLRQELENNPQERMMKIINDHNSSAGIDLPEAAELVTNAPDTLTNDQRSKLVNFMAGRSPNQGSVPFMNPPRNQPRRTSSNTGNANAFADSNGQVAPSLSPIMRSPPISPPAPQQIRANQEDLARLQELQRQQQSKISELGELLGPLSPSGHVPGLDDGNEAYFEPPGVDLDQYFDSNAYLNDNGSLDNHGDVSFGGSGNNGHFSHTGSDFNFDLDDIPIDRKPVKGQNTPSPTGTEEIPRSDLEDFGGESKRRRVA